MKFYHITDEYITYLRKYDTKVAKNKQESRPYVGIVVQIEQTATPTMITYLFDHPIYLIICCMGVFVILCLLLLYRQSVQSRKRQQKISEELEIALDKAREATESQQNFFSKMSHDIRTPLNVVPGMAQVARKYKHDLPRLETALDNISTEGNYLLVLINSILDVNQLEHSAV